ncbi:MAG TPA: 30S ribosome-binding factor RbfA [Actinomycetes bacterium]|nr:30S ribosome-binding factor RbfA [Actinomycetes bacterium]
MAKPGYPRARRLAETIRRVLTDWLEHQPADRRLGFVTITDVRVTGDLHHATVWFTVLDADVAGAPAEHADRRATVETLIAATGGARAWVAAHLRLRHVPTLDFREDDLAARGARIDRLLAELDPAPGEPPTFPERPST